MVKSHQKASRKVSKPPEKKKAIGRPPRSIKLVIRQPARSVTQDGDEDDSGSESGGSNDEEDELYGKAVCEDDGRDDDAVVSKPRRKKSGKEGDIDPREVEMVFMVPKPNSTSQKMLRLSSKTKWPDIRDRLVSAMGLDDDEMDDVSMSYRFSKDSTQTRNSLEDDDDYQGIVETLRARRAGAAPLRIIMFGSNGEEAENKKVKKLSKKAAEIEKAKATASAQSEVDEVITELKLANPVCAEHRTHCWTGHPSKEHVTVTEIRFHYWATEYLEHQKLPKDECKVTLDAPPHSRMFDVPPSNQKGHQSRSTSAPTPGPPSIPNIVVNLPDWAAGPSFLHNNIKRSCSQSRTPPLASDPADYNDEPWPSLHDFLLSVGTKDRHRRDLVSHETTLRDQEILRPDDIARCSADDLHESCGIPLGTAKLLVAEGQRVSQGVKSEARERKRRRES